MFNFWPFNRKSSYKRFLEDYERIMREVEEQSRARMREAAERRAREEAKQEYLVANHKE
jgi:hypothetical protein